jgi:hypothetical protein
MGPGRREYSVTGGGEGGGEKKKKKKGKKWKKEILNSECVSHNYLPGLTRSVAECHVHVRKLTAGLDVCSHFSLFLSCPMQAETSQ